MHKNKKSSQSVNTEQDIDKKNIFAFIKLKFKQLIFLRNYQLANNVEVSFIFVFTLFLIHYLQLFIMISLPSYNSFTAHAQDITFVVNQIGFLLVKFQDVQTQNSVESMVLPLLLVLQLFCLLSYLIPIKNHQINEMLYKYIILFANYTLYVPSIFLSAQNVYLNQNIYISLAIIALTLLNRFVFAHFQFQLSINAITKNMLTRNAKTTTNSKEIITFLSIVLFPACKRFLYPMPQMIYYCLMMLIHSHQVKQNCIGFNYHQVVISKLSGILNIFVTSTCLCYLTVATTQFQIAKSSMLSFVLAFFVFFSNFFLVFKKYYTKSIVIDSDLDTPTKAIIYVTWYMSCFRNTTQKKNQLYISSLLKNHINNCFESQCICKHRQNIYDPRRNQFGKPKWQPHVDNVFIKHFFLKIIKQNHNKFPKCNQILFILAFFNLEVMQFIPQTIQLIKLLKKKSIKKMLNMSQQYILYCLAERCYAKIEELNHLRGNLNLQKVKTFNEKILKLKQIIKISISMFSSLWKTICSEKYDKKNLVQICKKTLKIMFQIQENYHQIKKINNVSSQLKGYMILYSKLIAHDIHLLSQIRKQIRPNPQKSTSYNMTQIRNVQIFSKDTVTLITMDTNKIRWASKNGFSMFQYKNADEFMKLRINDLMPKYFGELHDKYIQNWKQTGYTSKINKTSYLWGSTKSGYCFSLSIYIKIIPLPFQQDFAFFAALQKLDQVNQIICSQQGLIYGCGKLFSSTIKCSQKFIQDYKPNIQIMMPSIFDVFLKNYYPQFKYPQSVIESRFQGYFPNNIQNIFKEILREKQIFQSKNFKKANFNQLYCHFLKEKMQQMTVYIEGQYLSFFFNINQNFCFGRSKKKIITLKINSIKKNNVQKYYNEIQKMIAKLQDLKAQSFQAKNKQKKYQKSMKKDYFKALLNPKRIKKLLQQEARQRQILGQNQLGKKQQNEPDVQNQDNQDSIQQSKQDISNAVNNQNMIGYRKKLALNAQHQIKNQRAKYNFWRIKKGLYDEGVISRYTYNLLVGKGAGFQSIKNLQTSNKLQEYSGTYKELKKVVGQDLSDDQLLSDNLTRNQGLIDDKPNDNETFNSATSSAAFISMTNNIKMFKIKLKSLNTPKLLYWLNVAFICIILLIVASSVTQCILFKQNIEYGSLYYSKGIQSAWAIDSMLNCKILGFDQQLLSSIKSNLNTSQYSDLTMFIDNKTKDYFNVVHSVMQLHVAQIQPYLLLDQRILGYLNEMILMVSGGDASGQLKILQFMLRQQDQVKQNINNINTLEMSQLLKIHQNIFSNNIFDNAINSIRIIIFVCLFFIILALLIVTIPIVYKIQSKIQEIIYLISKISINQRKRYYHQFVQLNEQTKKSQDFINQFNIQQYESKFKNAAKTNDEIKEDSKMTGSNSNSNKLKQEQKIKQSTKKQKTKFKESIYCKILTIYLVFLFVFSLKFIYLTLDFNDFTNTGQVFNEVMFQKLMFSKSMWLYSYDLNANQTSQMSIDVDHSAIVDKIYNSYHKASTSLKYEQFVTSMATKNSCELINENIVSSPLLNILTLSNSSLIQCSSINNGSFQEGLFNSLYYIQKKKQQILSMAQTERNQFIQQNSSFIFQLEKTQFYANLMIYAIQKKQLDQYVAATASALWKMQLCEYILAGFIVAFMLSWIYIYLNIAEKASYINAFLLLIPFDVLNENPYIKLYIKNEFDYKSSVY